MSLYKPPIMERLNDGSTYNPATGRITFGITLPVEAIESMWIGERPSPKPILQALARSIELQDNPLAKSALRAIFDCIYERTTEKEHDLFPNWFDSQ